MISNPQMAKKTYCGVLEFSAEEGLCYLPIWVTKFLTLTDDEQFIPRRGSRVHFEKRDPEEGIICHPPAPRD